MTAAGAAAPTVRRAGAADAAVLARLGEATFRAAFAAANDPGDMETYVAASFSSERLIADLADPANTYLLAEAGGTRGGPEPPCDPPKDPVGYAKLRAGAPDPAVTGDAPVELERIYAAVPGRGVGALLLRAAVDEALRAGHETLWLGVWEHNAGAIAFYEREGFTVVGTHPFTLGADTQTDLVMARPLR